MIFLIRFWRSLTKKDSVESAKYEGKKFLLVLQFFDVHFTDSHLDFYFWLVRIQTQKKV